MSKDDWVFGGVGLLLVIDLLFLPWFHVSVSFEGIHASKSFSGTDAPAGALGVIAVLTAIAAIADLAVERFAPQTNLPAINGSRAFTRLVIVGVTAAFLALKFLLHIHFNYFSFGFYLAVVLTVGWVFISLRAMQGVTVLK